MHQLSKLFAASGLVILTGPLCMMAQAQGGYVDLEAGNNQLSDKTIKLKDHNSTAYTVYYEVTASHCTDTTAPDIRLDPRIRNGGNN